ncbi:OmpA family protein [Accumulibacter sp.]|uniref:OmpA family protein n=1 Tax=Accumulibacter sp. TaxID=2053492 RepID=UPI0028C4C99D|nr:OmpA family protein [Accumulibacter sp.]
MLTFATRFCCVFAAVLALSGCGAWPWEPDRPQDAVRSDDDAEAARARTEKEEAAVEAKVIASSREEDNIYFSLGSVTVVSREKAKLQLHAEYLKQNPDTTVTLIGYTDDLGSRNYNVAIAEQRVLSVRKLLRSYHVPGGQIRRYSVGSEKTPTACKTSLCRQKMRRVELLYSPERRDNQGEGARLF